MLEQCGGAEAGTSSLVREAPLPPVKRKWKSQWHGTINIRTGPSGTDSKTGNHIHNGEVVEELERSGDWIRHSRGWSTTQSMNSNEVLMIDVTPPEPAAPEDEEMPFQVFLGMRGLSKGKVTVLGTDPVCALQASIHTLRQHACVLPLFRPSIDMRNGDQDQQQSNALSRNGLLSWSSDGVMCNNGLVDVAPTGLEYLLEHDVHTKLKSVDSSTRIEALKLISQLPSEALGKMALQGLKDWHKGELQTSNGLLVMNAADHCQPTTIEHTWTDAGPLGLQLIQRGDTKSSPGGVKVEDAAPFVPALLKGLVMESVAGEDVSNSSYDEVMAKLGAATRPLTVGFARSVEVLLVGSDDEDFHVRLRSAQLLRLLPTTVIISLCNQLQGCGFISKLLSDPEASVRAATARALAIHVEPLSWMTLTNGGIQIDEILGSYTPSNDADDIVTISKDNDGLIIITKKNGGTSSSQMSAAEFTANRKLHYLPYDITGDFKNNTITWSNGIIYSKVVQSNRGLQPCVTMIFNQLIRINQNESNSQVREAIVRTLSQMDLALLSASIPELTAEPIYQELVAMSEQPQNANFPGKLKEERENATLQKMQELTFGDDCTMGVLTENFNLRQYQPSVPLVAAELRNSISLIIGCDARISVLDADDTEVASASMQQPGQLLVPLSAAHMDQQAWAELKSELNVSEELTASGARSFALNMHLLSESKQLQPDQMRIRIHHSEETHLDDATSKVKPGQTVVVYTPSDSSDGMKVCSTLSVEQFMLDGAAELPVVLRTSLYKGDVKAAVYNAHCCDAMLLQLQSGLCLFVGVDRKTPTGSTSTTSYDAILRFKPVAERIKQTALADALASGLPAMRAKYAWRLFSAYDTDLNGFIDLKEFSSLLHAYDNRIEEAGVRQAFASQAPNGQMSFCLFCSWVASTFIKMDDVRFHQGIGELLKAANLNPEESVHRLKLRVRAKALSKTGHEILAIKCKEQYSEFTDLALEGWSSSQDLLLIQVLNDSLTRNDVSLSSTVQLNQLLPNAEELALMIKLEAKQSDEDRTLKRMVARLAVLRRLNDMINGAVMPAVELGDLQATMPGAHRLPSLTSSCHSRSKSVLSNVSYTASSDAAVSHNAI